MRLSVLLLSLFIAGTSLEASLAFNSDEPPVIPVGFDSFTMWDRWAYLRIGQRTYMTSTYDRSGGNEGADASHFLYQLDDKRNVTLDVIGEGILAFARYNHWHGSPWHYIVDGRDYVVQESSTPDPEHLIPKSVFVPEKQFPNPLTWTWSETKGADLTWVPIAFRRSFTMAYERTHYGTGYYIYHKFIPGARNLSRPINGWTSEEIPPKEVLRLIQSSGADIAPKGKGIKTVSGGLNLVGRQSRTLLDLHDAPSMIRALKFSVPRSEAEAFGGCILKIYWDDHEIASVDAPVNLLFGAGSLYDRENRAFLVKAFPVNIRFGPGRVHFAMYFPMPFLKAAKIVLCETSNKTVRGIRWAVRYERYGGPANWVANFHATYVDHGTPTPGKDLVFLDTTKVEGGGDWCGHLVGTSFTFSDRAVLTTLEGDPRFFFDDSKTPQVMGTGTEEWCGGGDYWGGQTMTLPFAGHPVGARSERDAHCDEDKIESAYRFLLSDLMPFGRNCRVQFEHGGRNESMEHYKSVTFWYGLHKPFLILTDSFHVGDEADEAAHDYNSPQASPVQTLSSRYEWGVDHLDGEEVYPEETDTGRFTKGTSTFTLRLAPRNLGVLLRRKFDYAFPSQCARVFVADVAPNAEWHEVGLWYTAGSNTCVYSFPREDLGKTQHVIQISNRRWREDEFLVPRDLTEGRSIIRVKLEFVPRNIPICPGYPLVEQAWSEYRYWAYCFVMPRIDE